MSAECLNLTATVHSLLEADFNVLMQNILALCSVQGRPLRGSNIGIMTH